MSLFDLTYTSYAYLSTRDGKLRDNFHLDQFVLLKPIEEERNYVEIELNNRMGVSQEIRQCWQLGTQIGG